MVGLKDTCIQLSNSFSGCFMHAFQALIAGRWLVLMVSYQKHRRSAPIATTEWTRQKQQTFNFLTLSRNTSKDRETFDWWSRLYRLSLVPIATLQWIWEPRRVYISFFLTRNNSRHLLKFPINILSGRLSPIRLLKNLIKSQRELCCVTRVWVL